MPAENARAAMAMVRMVFMDSEEVRAKSGEKSLGRLNVESLNVNFGRGLSGEA